MSNASRQTDVLIVGAGISGLLAAHVLHERGLSVRIVDKGASVGGRLATRRIGHGRADHGAQFFTVRSPEFRRWADRWLDAEVIYQWSNGFSSGKTGALPDGYPRYAVHLGMNNLAKHLAGQLGPQVDIHVGTRLVSIIPTDEGWEAQEDSGQTYSSRGILLTPPVPQSLSLLSHIKLSPQDQAALKRLQYAPCLAGIFQVEGEIALPDPGALQRPGNLISWIADNQRKGISPDALLITVHAGPDYSRQLWDAPEREVMEALRIGFAPYLAPDTAIVEAQIKRWRYAQPTAVHPERCLLATGVPPLVFAGDAFQEPRVEGAALSGLAAGRLLATQLS